MRFVESMMQTSQMNSLMNLKDGNSLMMSIISSLIIGLITILIQNISSTNMLTFIKSYCRIFSRRKAIILEGERVIYAGYEACANVMFTDAFKSIWYYIEKEKNNTSIREIKEYYTDADWKKEIKSMFMVHQVNKFTLHEYPDVHLTVSYFKRDDDGSKSQNARATIETVTIEIFTYKHSLAYLKDMVSKIKREYLATVKDYKKNKRYIYTLSYIKRADSEHDKDYKKWTECMFQSSRTFNTMFFDDKDFLVRKLDFFMNNKQYYYDHGIPWTLGIGMHGKPGTGKTSTIKCIANYTNRHLVVIPLNLIKTCSQLTDCFFESTFVDDNEKHTINFDNKIIVFEDIDCMTDVIKSRSSPKETVEKIPVDDKVNAKQVLALINNSHKKTDKSYSPMRILHDNDDDELTLSFILNLIDGIRETPGRIIILTSNHYDQLDKALIRPGRIDITLEMKNASRNTVNQIYENFYNEKIDDHTLAGVPDGHYSPAEVINMQFSASDSKEFIHNLTENFQKCYS